MRPSHAAALALVGWYLMTPPTTGNPKPFEHDVTAPLSRWTVDQAFDTAAECEGRCGQIGDELARKAERGRSFDLLDLGRMLAQCIASDDPRLRR